MEMEVGMVSGGQSGGCQRDEFQFLSLVSLFGCV
jgi:hypothetical protein